MKLLVCSIILGAISPMAAAQTATPLSLVTIGNSITIHAPSASIGWKGNWGMGASAADRDYSAQLSSLIAQSSKRQTNLARFNVSPVENNPAATLAPLIASTALAADIVVVELGDNVEQGAAGQFRTRYTELLRQVHSPSSILVCTSTYWSRPSISTDVKAACENAGGTFVDIGDIQAGAGTDSSYLADASNGVKKHPGDLGMKKIAEAIHSRLTNSPSYMRLASPK